MEQSPTFFDPTLFLLFGFMILIYFLMIRPENKRRKTHQEMLASLDTGEEIVTAGGILGKVTKISDQYIELSISDNTKIKIQKSSISAILPKGTHSNLFRYETLWSLEILAHPAYFRAGYSLFITKFVCT